jgi:hypothetical protein
VVEWLTILTCISRSRVQISARRPAIVTGFLKFSLLHPGKYRDHHHHHHHMALLPNSGPGLSLWGFVTITFFYRAGLLVQRPTPNLEDQETPGHRVAQLYPQALGTNFSRRLRHAWVTVGLFFNTVHHTGQTPGKFLKTRPRPLPSTSFPIHQSPIILYWTLYRLV